MIISLNLTTLGAAESRLRQRSDDLRHAASRVQSSRNNLNVHADHPDVRGLHETLDRVERRLQHVAMSVEEDVRRIQLFRTRAAMLDSSTGRIRVVMTGIVLARRLRSPVVQAAQGIKRNVGAIRQGLSKVGRIAFGALRTATRPGVNLFRKAQRFTSRTVKSAQSSYQRARHAIGSRIQQIKNWARRQWKRVTCFFRDAWNQAWAAFQAAIRGLRAVANAIRVAVARGAKSLARAGRAVYDGAIWLKNAILRTRFVEPPEPWSENVVSEQDFKGELQVNIPMKQFGFDIRLQPSVEAKVKHFDDGSMEVTLGAEFAAGVAAKLKAENPGVAKAELEAAVMAALGGERTYRLAPGSDVAAFITQQVTRAILQGIKATGGAAGGAAGLMLRAMPPAPEPVASSIYMTVGGELNASISVGNTGAKGKIEGEIEFRSMVGRDGSSQLEASFKVAAEAAVNLSGGAIKDAAKYSAEASGSLKLICGPDGLPTAVEVEVTLETRVGAEGKVGEIGEQKGIAGYAETGTAERQTVTTHVDIQPSDRSAISEIVKRMPGSAGELMAKLADITGRGTTETATERYGYSSGEVKIGTDQVNATFSTETRTNFERTAN